MNLDYLPNSLRGLARALRHAPDRALHSYQRYRVRKRARNARPVRSLLFVCHGNICRSPYAAAIFRRTLSSEVTRGLSVESAGFIGPGRPSPPEARAVAREHGVDLSEHRSQLVTPSLVRASQLILVMDPGQRRRLVATQPTRDKEILVLGDFDPGSIDRRMILDPVAQPESVFREVYRRIGRCVEELCRCVSSFREEPSLDAEGTEAPLRGGESD